MKRLLIIFSVLTLFLWALGAQEKTGKTGYAGTDTCKTCHEDQCNNFAESVHGKKVDPRTPASAYGCETCHGPGQAHADAGGGKGVGGILSLGSKSKETVEKRNAVCLDCHAGSTGGMKHSRANWQGSVHQVRGVACADCHDVHQGKNAKPETEACLQCHKQMKTQLLRNSHHPIREGKVSCADCHNPHGTVTDKLISADSLNDKCYECHADKRGPYLWEHPPVVENCMSCHVPHGSSHEKLLSAKQPFLCQTCHSNSRHPGTLYGMSQDQVDSGQTPYQALGNRVIYRSCMNCHNMIHGSNHPSGKALGR